MPPGPMLRILCSGESSSHFTYCSARWAFARLGIHESLRLGRWAPLPAAPRLNVYGPHRVAHPALAHLRERAGGFESIENALRIDAVPRSGAEGVAGDGRGREKVRKLTGN